MDFMEKLRSRYELSAEAAERLMRHAERISFAKKEVVTSEGRRDDYVYFVESGSVRAYVMREARCVIIFFAFEGDAASSVLGTTDYPTARYTIETLEASTLLRIPRQEMEELLTGSLKLANWGRKVAERMLRSHEEYFADYAWRDKGEQYLHILHEYPELLQRVPLKDLAAYLFVTPQTLSRIRAEIKK